MLGVPEIPVYLGVAVFAGSPHITFMDGVLRLLGGRRGTRLLVGDGIVLGEPQGGEQAGSGLALVHQWWSRGAGEAATCTRPNRPFHGPSAGGDREIERPGLMS